MTEVEALAICFRNLKGPRRKRLIETAGALKFLRDLSHYRTNRKVGAAVGVSGEMVREFISLLALPADVRSMLEEGALNLEHGRLLAQLAAARPDTVEEAALVFQGLRAHDTRDVTSYLMRHEEASVQEAVNARRDQASTVREEFHVVVELDPDEFELLARAAKAAGAGLSETARSVLVAWLSRPT